MTEEIEILKQENEILKEKIKQLEEKKFTLVDLKLSPHVNCIKINDNKYRVSSKISYKTFETPVYCPNMYLLETARIAEYDVKKAYITEAVQWIFEGGCTDIGGVKIYSDRNVPIGSIIANPETVYGFKKNILLRDEILRNQIDILSDQIDYYKMRIKNERETIDREREVLKEREEYCKDMTRRCGESIDGYKKAISSTVETIKKYENVINCIELNCNGLKGVKWGLENGDCLKRRK